MYIVTVLFTWMTQQQTRVTTARRQSLATDVPARVRHKPGVKLGVTLFATEAVVVRRALAQRVLMATLGAEEVNFTS